MRIDEAQTKQLRFVKKSLDDDFDSYEYYLCHGK